MGAFKELMEQLSCSWNTSYVGKGVGKGGVYCVMGVSDGAVDELRVLFAHVQNCYRVLHQKKYWIPPMQLKLGAVARAW